MKTTSNKMIEIVSEEPVLVYKVGYQKVEATQWEVYEDGDLVELSPMEMATLDLQHRIVQAYLDFSEGREVETIEDALDYVEYFVKLGLTTRLKERVANAQLSQYLYEHLSDEEIKALLDVLNMKHFEGVYTDDIIAHAFDPFR